MCYDPDPELELSLGVAQAAAGEREAVQAEEEQVRCCVCKQLYPEKRTYRTGAGTVCCHCAAEFETGGR